MKYAVIGAGFGDEGKGMTTAFLANKFNIQNGVRFNGGCQASHAVGFQDKYKIHRHFSSVEILPNRNTYSFPDFIINPIGFKEESSEYTISPNFYWTGEEKVSCPFDHLLNSFRNQIENHGTCGWGINETVKRYEQGFGFDFLTSKENDNIKNLNIIKNEYFLPALKILNIDVNSLEISYLKEINYFVNNFCKYFLNNTKKYNIENLLKEDIIFEGTQGLLLDQDSKFFPNVTHSKTGTYNIRKYYKDHLEVYYCIRPYLTRHGNGELPFQKKKKIYKDTEDRNNRDNLWQGTMRFAPINLDLLKEAITIDLKNLEESSFDINLSISCIDHLPSTCFYVENNIVQKTTKKKLIEILSTCFSFKNIIKHKDPNIKKSTIETI